MLSGLKNHIFLIFRASFILLIIFIAGQVGVASASVKTPVKPPLEISGWIPYWRVATGTTEAIAHIGLFSEISPFGYSVKHDGTLADIAGIGNGSWAPLIAAAKASNVKIIPTVMWSNTADIQTILSSTTKRKAHVAAIVSMVKQNNFDGVDIDYEAKSDKTEKYFSLFLHDLWHVIGNKEVSCTIEARTPLDSRFAVIPQNITYANDYTQINKYCDRVRIMTYDQGTVDLQLNKTAVDPYAPIADPVWVNKVIELAEKSISKNKIFIGVATYGYEYTVTPLAGGYSYDRETAFNPNYAMAIATSFGITPQRNLAGELSFSYTPTSTPLSASLVTTTTTPSLDSSLFGVSTVTNSTGSTSGQTVTGQPFRLLWWSDAQAIKTKMDLAKQLGVRGISIFKIDGGADQALWQILQSSK